MADLTRNAIETIIGFESEPTTLCHGTSDWTRDKRRWRATTTGTGTAYLQSTTIDKGRRLIGRVAQLRRTSRLRAGGRNVALARPLSAGDPLSVLIDTKKGPVILPFRVDSGGVPHVPGHGEDGSAQESGALRP